MAGSITRQIAATFTDQRGSAQSAPFSELNYSYEIMF